KSLIVGNKTSHIDPSNDIMLMFAPIKHTDDLINMATQMGVARFVPVITARTVAHHINWGRMRKIAVEAAEQSNRNSVPEILEPVKFNDLDLSDVVFADERAAYGENTSNDFNTKKILIGPEGGFSDDEFSALDAAGARGIGLGKTILRAETAAIVALAKIIK
ncbi:MAG: 16S rRNA (uracil(1498)-N(3))-methyltransferase, partial [Alphaproteobacteria bacterium]|nr:16S rRNA (uracil(1498)-N(3))-methyltransferase [Alphaproteobacteria bacterium]